MNALSHAFGMLRFVKRQYRLSCRAGFGVRKSIQRAFGAWVKGF